MKHPLYALIIAFLSLVTLHAADDPRTAVLSNADDARISAMKSADRGKLEIFLSADLRYAHSNGIVDSKASFIESLTSAKLKYAGYDCEERTFTFPAPQIALMTGRAHVQAENATGNVDSILSYLAVWREEGGQWRFLAWQSCKLPAPTPQP